MLRLRRYERISVQNRPFGSNGGQLTQNFRYKGSAPTNHSSSQKTRLNDISFVWYKNLDRSFFCFVTIHAFYRRTAFSSLYCVCIPCIGSAGKSAVNISAEKIWLAKNWAITAELGRALAVVKVTVQVNGNSQYLEVRPSKTIGAIKIKSGTNDYFGEGNPHAKFGNIPIIGGFSPYRWNITFRMCQELFLT